jgi:transposase
LAVNLVRKTVRKHQYWYLVESRRVDGKPRIVWQRYLGKAEDIAQKLAAVRETEVYDFGAVAATLAVAHILDLEAIVNRHAQKRRQGIPVGRFILLAVLNRIVAPRSKAQIGTWHDTTVLRRLWGTPASAFTSQAFWSAMDHLDQDTLEAIENDLAHAAVEKFGVRIAALAYDGTNFATYISTQTPSELAQRGHNKQKRADLRQVSLALLATVDGHVPLLHDTYAGNVPDPIEFGKVLSRMQRRLQSLAVLNEAGITVVFDKGNPSKANFADFGEGPDTKGMSFVSSLSLGRHPDLAAVALADFTEVDKVRWPGLMAYRTEKTVYGSHRRVVVTYNPALAQGQLAGIRRQQGKIESGLRTLVDRLSPSPDRTCRPRRTTRAGAERYVKRLLARYSEAGSLLWWEATEDEAGQVRLSYAWDPAKVEDLEAHHLGRTVLFTDHMDWDDAAIVAAYRSQGTLENAFRQMKDPHFVTVTPMFHWTDPKIRVHLAICVMALMVASLLHREARKGGFDQGFDALLETLGGIRGVVDLPAEGSRERPRIRLTKRTAHQNKLYTDLGLERFDPTTRRP